MSFWRQLVSQARLPDLQTRTVILFIVLGASFVLHLFTVPDPDYYWHLRTGQYIAETRRIPDRDPFSYTAGERPWIVHEWGAQLVIYGLDRAFGYPGVLLFFSALTTFALFVQHRLLLRLGVNHLLASVLVCAEMIAFIRFLNVRPLTFSWLFLTVYLFVLYRFHRGHKAPIWVLPPLMAIWVNLHGGFIIGLVLMGLLFVAELIEARLWKQPHRLKVLGAALVATALAALINPNVSQGFLYPLSYLGEDNASFEFITEWQSPNFHNLYWIITVYLPILVVMALGLGHGALGLWPFLVSALVTLMALHAVRNVPIFAIVITPVIGEVLKARFVWAQAQGPRPETPTGVLINWGLLVAIGGAALLIVPLLPHRLKADPFDGKGPYPVQGAEFVLACYPNARIFNEYAWGGYLLYRFYPHQRVFIDGRADLYGGQLLRDYAEIVRLRPKWEETLNSYGFDLVLTGKDTPFAIALGLHPDWERVFVGEVEAIFVRRGTEAQPTGTGDAQRVCPGWAAAQ